jgi:hypothetical protein
MITLQLGHSKSLKANETVGGRSNLLPLAMKVVVPREDLEGGLGVKKIVIESIISLPWKVVKRGKKNQRLLNGYLKLT